MASKTNNGPNSVRYLKFQEYRHFMKRAGEAQELPLDTLMRELMASEAVQADISRVMNNIEQFCWESHWGQICNVYPDELDQVQYYASACDLDPTVEELLNGTISELFSIVWDRYCSRFSHLPPQVTPCDGYMLMQQDGYFAPHEGLDYSHVQDLQQAAHVRFNAKWRQVPFPELMPMLVREQRATCDVVPGYDDDNCRVLRARLLVTYLTQWSQSLQKTHGVGARLLERYITEVGEVLVTSPARLERLIYRAIIARYPNDDDAVSYFEPAEMALVDSTQRCARKNICQLLCRFLSIEDAIALSKTCKTWNGAFSSLMNDSAFVKSLYMARFFLLPPRFLPQAPMTWRHLYLYQVACERAPPKSVPKWTFFRIRCRLGSRTMVFDTPANAEEAQKLWAQLANKPQAAKITNASKAN